MACMLSESLVLRYVCIWGGCWCMVRYGLHVGWIAVVTSMSTLDNSGREESPTEQTHFMHTFFFSELTVVNFVVLKIFETSVLLVRYKVKRAPIIQNCVQSDFTSMYLSLLHSSLVPRVTAAIVACSTNNVEKKEEKGRRIRTANDDSCGGGLGMRLATFTSCLSFTYIPSCIQLNCQ